VSGVKGDVVARIERVREPGVKTWNQELRKQDVLAYGKNKRPSGRYDGPIRGKYQYIQTCGS